MQNANAQAARQALRMEVDECKTKETVQLALSTDITNQTHSTTVLLHKDKSQEIKLV